MVTALFPGSFDPPTNGHLEVIERASRVFDRLIVLVQPNTFKNSAFSLDERVKMLERAVGGNPKVSVRRGLEGRLLAELAVEIGVSAVVKGLRNTLDYAYECEMASLNRQMTGIETLFVMTSGESQYISSSRVREIASLHGDISKFVPAAIVNQIVERYTGGKTNE